MLNAKGNTDGVQNGSVPAKDAQGGAPAKNRGNAGDTGGILEDVVASALSQIEEKHSPRL
ncbi:hypothetical protein H4R24_004052 [Coemansia sp. RSA 988]|nr:hypothetical protein H4R24_004052 [Coemansia sp. RSA 988]